MISKFNSIHWRERNPGVGGPRKDSRDPIMTERMNRFRDFVHTHIYGVHVHNRARLQRRSMCHARAQSMCHAHVSLCESKVGTTHLLQSHPPYKGAVALEAMLDAYTRAKIEFRTYVHSAID